MSEYYGTGDLTEEELYYDIGYRFKATRDGRAKDNRYITVLLAVTLLIQFFAFSVPVTLLGVILLYLYLNSKQFNQHRYLIFNCVVLLGITIETHGEVSQLTILQWILLISWSMLFLLNLVTNEGKEQGKKVITPVTENAMMQYTNFNIRTQNTPYEVTEIKQSSMLSNINRDQVIYWGFVTFTLLVANSIFSAIIYHASASAGIAEEFLQDSLTIIIISIIIILLPSLLQKKE